MNTIPEIRCWQGDLVSATGTQMQTAAATLDRAMETVARAMDQMAAWVGDTRHAIGSRVDEQRDHAAEIRNVLNQIADEVLDAATDLTHACTAVLNRVDAAVADGFLVTDSGEVAHPDGTHREQATTIQAHLRDGLATIAALDADYGARLDALRADLSAMTSRQPPVTLPDGRHLDPDDVVATLRTMTPEQRRNMLSAMSEHDRRRVMQADPHTIGNMDGVDFATRADANEIAIRTALAAEQRAGRADGTRARRLAEFLRQTDDPSAGRDDLDRTSERRFIAFDTTGAGRYIEMIGTFDGARNATILVPGTHSSMNSRSSTTDAAPVLSRSTGGPVFVYLDGDLPQRLGYEGLEAALPALARGDVPSAAVGATVGLAAGVVGSAADPSFARAMAPRLVEFGKQLDAEIAHHAPGATTTVIGHSYGGSVVGSAEQLGLRADRVVYASSAGTGVFDGPWRNANPDVERFSMTAPGDPIGVVQLLGPLNPHGSDPDTAAGVTRLDSGRYSDGTLIEGTHGHGDYWKDPGSTAFRNMVDVVRGDSPTPYVERRPDGPLGLGLAPDRGLPDREPLAALAEGARDLLALGLGPLGDLLDGDIDLPGPIPDVPLRLPW
ncbi:alpha/beta hydrolase [Gordonia sp. ABSL11-1]|uniref:alpha/beta hydrolase n=1 Tax=Gordonia sp. ABSL11-1 TaxID=3053924 RepID=UPI002573C282|nr:alpha/beta hydrolase [Gordonia sp. ABSL11-1]MDL9946581.1 alpha/beta hydrolase [Gordonia sp. ABSL11-1]